MSWMRSPSTPPRSQPPPPPPPPSMSQPQPQPQPQSSRNTNTVPYASMNDDKGAKYRRELLHILDYLRSMGFSQELTLPQIVVVGSQSAGKSSLIESLCKIKLPRSTGTCTRCPIECRSHYAEHPWEARVFLRFEGEGGERRGLGAEIPFGDPIDDPALIEERIKQAQLAVLNPEVDIDLFLQGESGPFTGGLSFTTNSVVVKISGKDLSDIIFVDLPGIISSTTDERNGNDINLVQKLIDTYMKKSTTINLVVITCETDYETQAAGQLARTYDPSGERTIGVLTKPDRIETHQEHQWIPLITGSIDSLRLKNGWFCVKQLTTHERESGLSWDAARNQEVKYFETAPGWSTIATEHKANLGSRSLALKLGDVLSRELQKRLPTIRLELDKLIRENESEIGRLPEHCIDGPRELVLLLVTRFVRDVQRQLIDGDPAAGREGVVQKMRTRQVELREELQKAAPVFLPSRTEGQEHTELARPDFLPEDEAWLTKSELKNEHTVDDVAKTAQWSRTREWSGHYPFEAILIYMRKVIDLWRVPIESTFRESQFIFERKLMELVQAHFSAYNHGGLLGAVKTIASELLDKCKKETEMALKDMLDQEWHPESAHEEHYLAYEDKFLDYYRSYFDSNGLKRLAAALTTGTHSELTQAISVLQQFGLPALTPCDWQRIQPMKKTQVSVLRIMASVRAHYQISYRRFADKAKDTVDQSYVRAFGRDIEKVLCKKLGLSDDTSEDHFAELTRESDDMLALRRELNHKAEVLRAARIKLS